MSEGPASQDPELLRRLLRAKDRMDAASHEDWPVRLSITEIAFHTGWGSLGTFGRIFRDVTGKSPGAIRARGRATARELGRVPACFLSAAHRPDLTIAVSEKRRQVAGGINGSEETEVP